MIIGTRVKPKAPPVEPGTYLAVCVGIYDLGEQQTEYKKKTHYANQVMFTFEIPAKTIEVDGEMKPRQLSRTFAVSASKKGNLRKFLGSWTGTVFTDDAFSAFDTDTLLGSAAMIQVVLNDTGEYANIDSIMQLPEGLSAPQTTTTPVSFDIEAWDDEKFDALAGNYSSRLWADTTRLAENVRDIVTRGLMTGGNYADMAAELAAQMGDVQFRKKVEPDGSTRTVATGSGAKYRATRLIRTEGNYITGQAKLQSMRDAGYEKYEFICLLEIRTCSVCGGLDGKQFPVADAQPGVNMNPMHPNCRCFVSPVVSKRLMEAGTRGAQVDATGRKETVPTSMTYQEWYEKYVKGNQEMLTSQKMLQNKASDKRQYASYQQVLGDKAPKTFAEFQDLKYNDSEGWARLKRERVTISKIDGSNWPDKFKDKAKSLYYQFREDDIEIGYHAIGRFFSRQTDRQGNKVFDYADIRDIYRRAANYVQPDSRLVHYYNSIAVIVDNETAEIITIVCRRHPKADWRGFGD